MEALIIVIILAYAVKKSAERGHLHWQSARAGNRGRSRGRSVPRRAASAVQHDVGYWFHQVTRGFPQARTGLAAGWHAGRTAQAQGAAARQRAKAEHLELRARLIPELREHRRRQREAHERILAARYGAAGGGSEGRQGSSAFPVLLTARSRSGRPVSQFTGAPEDTIAVYGQDDLDRRLKAAAADPDVEVTTRPAPDLTGPVPGEGSAGAGPGGRPPAGASPEPAQEGSGGTAGGASSREEQAAPTTEGSTTMASDVTYDSVQQRMAAAVGAADLRAAYLAQRHVQEEEHVQETAAARQWAATTAEHMQALGLDSNTLGAMADHVDAVDAAARAQADVMDAMDRAVKEQRRVLETAQATQATLRNMHSGLNQAHQEAPVEAADKEFYAG